MDNELENVPGISSVRKVLARQHVSPDGWLVRLESSPFDKKQKPALGDSSAELDESRSRYFLDASYASILKMEERSSAHDWWWDTGDVLHAHLMHYMMHLAHQPADHNELEDMIFRDSLEG